MSAQSNGLCLLALNLELRDLFMRVGCTFTFTSESALSASLRLKPRRDKLPQEREVEESGQCSIAQRTQLIAFCTAHAEGFACWEVAECADQLLHADGVLWCELNREVEVEQDAREEGRRGERP